jgi:hypothetical protein
MAVKFLDATAAPLTTAVLGNDGKMNKEWEEYFHRMAVTLNAIPSILNLVSLSDQSAQIAYTAFENSTIVQGIYRVSGLVRVSRAAGTSSSIRLRFRWVQDGVAQQLIGVAQTGNTTATNRGESSIIRADAGTNISYRADYSSSGTPSMQFSLDAALERIRPRGNF